MLDLLCFERIWRTSERLEKNERKRNGLELKRRGKDDGAEVPAVATSDIEAASGTGSVITTTFAGETTGIQLSIVQKDPDLDPILRRTNTGQIGIAPRTTTAKKSPGITGKTVTRITV